jgi:hypothetical protein
VPSGNCRRIHPADGGDWPDDWESRVAGATCVICDALPMGDTDYWIHVDSGPCPEVYLDRGSQIRGHCLVVTRAHGRAGRTRPGGRCSPLARNPRGRTALRAQPLCREALLRARPAIYNAAGSVNALVDVAGYTS